MVPTLHDLFTLTNNAQGEPCGLRRDTTKLQQHARTVPLDALVAVLEGSDDLLQLLGALHLASQAIPPNPPDRLRLRDALLVHVADARVHTWSWGDASYQGKTFAVAVLAAEGVVRILEHEARLRRRKSWLRPISARSTSTTTASASTSTSDPTTSDSVTSTSTSDPTTDSTTQTQTRFDLGDVLLALLTEALSGTNGAAPVRTIIAAYRHLCHDRDDKEELAHRLARHFSDVACDRTRVATLRTQAIDALEKVILTNPLGQSDPFEAARGQIADVLLASMDDATEDFRFRKQIRATLTRMAPERIEELQHRGDLQVVPLPPAGTLLNTWGMPSDERARAAVALMTPQTILTGLGSEDPDTLISAACFAPLLGNRADWRPLAHGLLAAIRHPGFIEHTNPRGRTSTLKVGPLAAERLLKLLGSHLRKEDDEAISLFFDGLRLLLEHAPIRRRSSVDPVQRYLREIRWIQGPLQNKLRAQLSDFARSPEHTPTARFAALLADRRPETDIYAFALIRDASTPDALKVLIGSQLHQWCPEQLTAWADTDAEPWTLHPGAPDALPISEPGRKVPISWLIAALKTSTYDPVTFSTVRSLSARLGRRPETPNLSTLRERLTPWIDDRLTLALRGVLDAPATNEPPYWSAAVCLALVGDLADEDRLVRFAIHHGAWTRLDPLGDAFLETNLLDHLILRPLQHTEPHHMLEPYLLTGFGTEHTHRMMAKIFVGLGQQARRDGLIHSARWACRLALRLDPLNLMARRGERL